MRKAYLIILCCFFIVGAGSAANFNFNSLGVKDGLPDNYIHAMMQDSYGFMWFVTVNELNRYDGYNFKNYPLVQEGSDVYSIREDANNNIWIQAGSKYYYYNREKDEIEGDITPVLETLSIPTDVSLLVVDHDKNLWCQIGDRIVYDDISNNHQTSISLPYDKKLEWVECRDGHAFFLFGDGTIGELNPKYNKITEVARISLSAYPHHRMYLDSALNLWLYTAHSPEDILRYYDPKTQQVQVFRDKNNQDFSFVTSLIDDGQGNIWIGTDNNGITVFNYNENTYQQVKYDQKDMFTIPSNHINCFYFGRQNIMWVGTSKRGIGYTVTDKSFFERCTVNSADDISCIVEERDGSLWFGSDGNGITRVDVNNGKTNYFNIENGSLREDLVVCSFYDSKDRIWFGTYGGGVCYYENKKFHHVNYTTGGGEENPLRFIRAITEDVNGNIWIGTVAKGLFCYNVSGNVSKYTIENSQLQSNAITDLYCQQGSNLYIATSAGACVMDINALEINRITFVGDEEFSNSDAYVNCILKDSRNLLWIGGKNGVFVLSENQCIIAHLTTENGLSNNFIRAITEDEDRNLWLSTDYGITNVLVDTPQDSNNYQFHCRSYYDEDGLGSITFNNHSIVCRRNDEILIGGIGGYVRVTPESIPEISVSSGIEFTALYIGNKLIEPGESEEKQKAILNKNIQLLDEVSLDYKYNNFSLNVSSLDFRSLNKTIFAYRLDEDSEWIKFQGNTIYFNELAPGTYNLQVKRLAPTEGMNGVHSSLLIHIKPPFLLSPIAYAIYSIALILFAVALGLYFRRKNLLKIKMHQLEMDIAQQQKIDEEKMRFFTNVSHDLRTPLSLIITPLERLIASSSYDRNTKENLKLMYRNAKILMREVNQLLDLRKLDSGRSELKLSHGNLVDFVTQVCDNFTPYALKKRISLTVNPRSQDIEMDFDRSKLQRVLMNLLSNAFKFNIEGGSVYVSIDRITSSDRQYALIEVADTGIGIKEENLNRVFDRFYQETQQSTYIGSGIGLHIAKEYVLLHGGEIQVRPNVPQGSIFSVKLPISSSFGQVAEIAEIDSDLKLEIEEKFTDDPILVVEDNDDFRQFICSCIKDYYPVIEASDGAEALELMAEKSVKIVVSDVMMPVMDGLELCNKIKGDIRFSHIPVMLLTAKAADEHILAGLKEGADEYIVKPFNVEILLLRIKKLLEWGKSNHQRFQTIDIEPSEITISSLDEKLIKQAIQFVEENIDNQEFSVEDLSAAIGMSRGHLYKKLMNITGKSPLEFIRTIRVKRGKQLVEKSKMNISEIAYSIGFSPKQFSKYFREHYGELPSIWQQRNG